MIKTFTYSRITSADNFKFEISITTLHESSFEIHTHEFSELVIILGGTAIHITDAGHYPIATGDVFVMNGEMSHGFEDCAGLRLCNIMYDPEQLLVTQSDIQQLEGYHALFVVEPLYRIHHPMHNLLRLSIDALNTVDSLINKMIAEYDNKSIGYMGMIQAYFMQLVVMLSRLHSSQVDIRVESIGRLAKALILLETHYDQQLSLQNLADAAHLSPTHFLRLFKETFDTSPIQYLIRLRIAKACQLLHDRRYHISSVSQQVGFADSNYFSRQFKQIMGQSPQAYQKSNTHFQLRKGKQTSEK
jgi:AraC-like DNA-binding protein